MAPDVARPTAGTGTGRPGGPSRRTTLRALALPALASLAPAVSAGCGRSGRGTVRVAVQWSGWELTAFQQVVAQFTSDTNWDVAVLPVGSDINALLGARSAREATPDVAMLSQPGQVRQFRRRLTPIDPAWAANFPTAWRDLVTIDGEEMGVWFKTAHKSMVWYLPGVLDRQRVEPPRTYLDWLGADQRLGDAGLAPLAVGAADGWVLSDWFCNVLLGLDPQTYGQLARGGTDAVGHWRSEPVREALTLVGQAWARPGTFPGGVRRALLTQFDESVVEVYTRRQAAMVAEGDFVYPVISRYGRPDVSVAWFPFPPQRPGGDRPVLVGGDVAVLLDNAGPGGRDLVRYLGSAEAANVWARQGGFVSVLDRGVPRSEYPPVYTDTTMTDRPLIDDVRTGMDGSIEFSLSDQIVGPLAGGDGQGLWAILQNFLRQVAGADGEGIDSAAARTVRDIVDRLRSR
ncbi:MAG TPA: ABC transporter substrate-binding protein [Mycobacteriales bacterium]|nr:ABC transporter substrate-binding protein [Mycobacteriales bacterium]